MIQVFYKGVDVTDNVSINQCYHDMYAEGRCDALTMRFNDTANLWDKWSPQIDDEINVVYGSIRTGKMYVAGIVPTNGLYMLKALAAPKSAFCRRYKAWQKVTLSQIAAEIASRHGLTFSNQGVDDNLYGYILQKNESDFAFLHKRCVLEGCAFLTYDGKLVLFKQSDMEQQAPLETVTLAPDSDYRYDDNSRIIYGSCLVECGDYSGKYIADAANPCVLLPQTDISIGNDAEAARFARGFLREANKGAYTGYVRGQIMPQYAAASVVELVNDRAPSWNGAAYITHLRNDYAAGTSKMFFRRPLEGY